MTPLIVIAVGGNSLIRRRDRQSVEDQYDALCETMAHVADVIADGARVLITHGNGPQVGFILQRSDIALAAGMHPVPMPNAVADTQGSIGYQILQALGNELAKRGLPAPLAALVTQTLVDIRDPALHRPDKFIGSFYSEAELPALSAARPDWTFKRDGERGWRRVAPSPEPLDIVELDAVKALLAAGFHVVAGGGGGIPVVQSPEGLRGVDAVVDKDLASALLANRLGARTLVISTAVERVCLWYGQPEERTLGRVTLAEMERYAAGGHFPPGSMGPKIRAAIRFLRGGGRDVIITSPETMSAALRGEAGTHIVAE